MKRKNLVLTTFVALFIIGVVIVGAAAASSGTKVSVDPPYIWDPTMVPGTEFTVDIIVENVENLWAYQFWLNFNPKVIHGVSVENGGFLGGAGGEVVVAAGAGFDNIAGELKLFGAFIKFEVTPPHDKYLADGSGILATVTFEVVGSGKSDIVLGYDTRLSDKWANEIAAELEHGHFANAEVHDVAVTHISTNAYYCVQGDPVYITVIVENLGDFTETFDVEVYSVQMGGSSNEISIGMKAVENLAPGDSATLPFTWDTTGASLGSYHIYAEASTVAGESAWTTNNIIQTAFKGIALKQYEATLLDLVVSGLNFALRAALPVAAFVMIAIVFIKSMTSVGTRWSIRLSEKECFR